MTVNTTGTTTGTATTGTTTTGTATTGTATTGTATTGTATTGTATTGTATTETATTGTATAGTAKTGNATAGTATAGTATAAAAADASPVPPRRTVTAAVVQAAAPLFDTPAAVARAEELIREAAGRGAEVVVLPEAFIGGYPKGLDFGITVGSRTPAGRDLFRRYHAAAIEVPGPETATLAAVTRELGCHVVVGAVERHGGTLYCVALFFGPDGYLGLHRKLMPTAAER